MANYLPTVFFPGYTYADGKLQIPLEAITGLTAGLANATTGDGREIIRLMVESITTRYEALTTKPAAMTATRQRIAAGNIAEQVTQEYALSFLVNTPMESNTMPAEP